MTKLFDLENGAKFRGRVGSRLSTVKARKYGKRLLELERRHGVVNAGIVLDDARAKSSPLHDYFEWSDSKAAQEYRMEQARRLMRYIEVVVESPMTKAPRNIRAFIQIDRLGDAEGGSYRNISSVLSDADSRQVMLDEALAELESFRRKYAILKELADVFDVIDRMSIPKRRPRMAAVGR